MRDQGTREPDGLGWRHPLRRLRWRVLPDGNHRIEGMRQLFSVADVDTEHHDPGDEDRS